jgi:HTH-type transcriptional regulator, sugar sensing transcriptional regulator
MKTDEPFRQLLSLGLTEYESKAYLAMLQKQSSSASELSKLSGVPRTRIYDILDRLARNGLCVERLGKEKKYQAVAPEIAMQRLLEHQKAEFIVKEKIAASLSAALKSEFEKGVSNNDPLDYIELLRDPKQVSRRVMELVSGAKREILVFVKPPFSNPKRELEKQNDESIQAVKRQIEIRAIYEFPQASEEIEWMYSQIERSSREGEKSRVIDKLPLKMVVVDETKVIFAMEDFHKTANRQTSLLIEHHALASSLKILFETLWERARDYQGVGKSKIIAQRADNISSGSAKSIVQRDLDE